VGAEALQLSIRKTLIAEAHDQVLQPRRADRGEIGRSDRLREIDAADLGAQRIG